MLEWVAVINVFNESHSVDSLNLIINAEKLRVSLFVNVLQWFIRSLRLKLKLITDGYSI